MNKRALIRVVVVPVHGCARMVLHDATAATRVLLLLEAEASIGMCVELRRVESGRVDANIKCGLGRGTSKEANCSDLPFVWCVCLNKKECAVALIPPQTHPMSLWGTSHKKQIIPPSLLFSHFNRHPNRSYSLHC